jgi:phenylacetate-CoA ligase
MRIRELIRCTSLLGACMQSEWQHPAHLRRHQCQLLVDQIRFAQTHVPFYRNAYAAAGLTAGSVTSLADLAKLPIVRREQVQLQPDAFLAETGDRERWRSSKTSGSTGRPLVTWFDPGTWRQVKGVLKARRLLAWGWRPGERLVVVDAIDPAEISAHAQLQSLPGERWLGARTYLSIFEPPEKHVAHYRAIQPNAILAFPSYFMELAKVWDADLRQRVPLRALMTSSEWIHPSMRKRLQQEFGVPILDVYGSNEFKEIAWQCHKGGYHVNMESLVVEVLGEDGLPAASGMPGDVVVTSLTNKAMPLIRYATGDRAIQLGDLCQCGRGLQRLDRIEGRVADYLRIPGVGLLSPYELTTAVETQPGVLQYKICQLTQDRLVVRVVLKPGVPSEVAEAVCAALTEKVGGKMQVTVEQVLSIARAPSGKARCVEIDPHLAEAAG